MRLLHDFACALGPSAGAAHRSPQTPNHAVVFELANFAAPPAGPGVIGRPGGMAMLLQA